MDWSKLGAWNFTYKLTLAGKKRDLPVRHEWLARRVMHSGVENEGFSRLACTRRRGGGGRDTGGGVGLRVCSDGWTADSGDSGGGGKIKWRWSLSNLSTCKLVATNFCCAFIMSCLAASSCLNHFETCMTENKSIKCKLILRTVSSSMSGVEATQREVAWDQLLYVSGAGTM